MYILVFLFGGGLSMAASTIARATMILEIYDELLEIIAWFVKKSVVGYEIGEKLRELTSKDFPHCRNYTRRKKNLIYYSLKLFLKIKRGDTLIPARIKFI